MASSTYFAASLALLAVVAVLTVGAWRLRTRVLPDWTGAPARLAEIVISLTVPFTVAQILGMFGAFARFPMLIGCLVVGSAMAVVGRSAPAPAPTARGYASRPEEVIVAACATAVVTAQWVMHTTYALGRGMTHGDTLWYHAPFAVRFVQTGYLVHTSHTGLEDLATPLHGYLPLNGSLAHAMLILPFHRDILSPVLNLAFFALALFAGWCIGARRGVGALTLLGTAVMLGLPTLTGTQPGQASNDVTTAALFFVAVALLFEGDLRPVPTAIAAIAAGLALGTKLTVLAPVSVLTIGVVFLAVRARRYATALGWCVALFFAGGYWLVRNSIVAGNPVPWSKISIGPFTLDRALDSRPALTTLLDERSTWSRFIWPGFHASLGRGWIVVLVVVVGGAIACLVRPRPGIERVAAISAIVGIGALPFIPFSADFGGGIFVYIVRYLLAEFLVGIAVLTLLLADAPVVARRACVVLFALLVVSDVTSSYVEGTPSWPPGQVVAGIATAIVVLGLALTTHRGMPHRAFAVAGPVAVLLAVGGGWFVQRHYLDERYRDAGLPHDAVNAFFRDVHDARVAAIARDATYPLFGLDLSNRVSRVDGLATGTDTERCRAWRRDLRGFDYVVAGADPLSTVLPHPEWIADDPATTVALRDGSETVYRLDANLDPDGCP